MLDWWYSFIRASLPRLVMTAIFTCTATLDHDSRILAHTLTPRIAKLRYTAGTSDSVRSLFFWRLMRGLMVPCWGSNADVGFVFPISFDVFFRQFVFSPMLRYVDCF